MARTARRRTDDDLGPNEAAAFAVVSDAIQTAIRETLTDRSHEPARAAIKQLTSLDDEFAATGQPPPGWTLAFLTLARWSNLARAALADRPEPAEKALAWIETNLGRRYRARAGYTIGAFADPARGDELAAYVEALGEDFLPTLVWTLAALVELYAEGDAGWPRRLDDEAG